MCNVGKATGRKLPEFFVIVFLKGCEHLNEVQRFLSVQLFVTRENQLTERMSDKILLRIKEKSLLKKCCDKGSDLQTCSYG